MAALAAILDESGHEFQLNTTTGPKNYIALGFVSASYVGLKE